VSPPQAAELPLYFKDSVDLLLYERVGSETKLVPYDLAQQRLWEQRQRAANNEALQALSWRHLESELDQRELIRRFHLGDVPSDVKGKKKGIIADRQWIAAEVCKSIEALREAECAAGQSGGFIGICGRRGAGKSTFLCHLVYNQLRGAHTELVPLMLYFCQEQMGGDADPTCPSVFVRSLIAQLCRGLPSVPEPPSASVGEYESKRIEVRALYRKLLCTQTQVLDIILRGSDSDADYLLEKAVLAPLRRLSGITRSHVLVIDGLPDVRKTYLDTRAKSRSIAELLARAKLPSWLYVVASSTNMPAILREKSNFQMVQIDSPRYACLGEEL
jgi:hypothetical protein